MSHAEPDTDGPDRIAPAATPLALVKHLRGAGFTVVDADRHVSLGQLGAGRQPHTVVRHPSGRWAYVPYMGSNTLEVIDLRTLDVVAAYDDIGTAPVGATRTRTGRYLFVTTYGGLPTREEAGIVVFETTTDGRLDRVAELPVGKAAGIVTDARNDVWVALKDDSDVVRLDGQPPFDERDRFAVPGDPQTLSFVEPYGLLGVNNVADGSVTFIDVLDRQPLATVPAPNPRGGCVAPAVDRWFVGNTEGDGLTVVDLDAVRTADGDRLPSAATELPLGTPTAFTDAHPDGSLVVVDAYEDDRVTFLDPATLEEVARVRTGGTPHHPQFSADGRVCYVPNQDADTVTVLDTASVDPATETVDTVAEIELRPGSAPSGCYRTDRR